MSDTVTDDALEDQDDGPEPDAPVGPTELGLYSVDELAALAPGRVDLFDGDEPDAAAGARALLAGGRVRLADDDEGALAAVPTEAAAVVARFLTEPERTVVVRIDDLFGTDQYVLHGRTVDDELCYVLEGGTAGIRRLVFVLAEDAPGLIAGLVGLDELAETGNADEEPREVDVEAELPAGTTLGEALAHPRHSVTVSAARPGGEPVDVSFVHGDDAAWLVEWTGETTARVSPLDTAAVSDALTRLLV